MLVEAVAAVVVLAILLKLFGCFDTAEVKEVENPEAFAGGVTVYYKYHVGNYGAAYGLARELMQLIPNGEARGFGVFYDDPAKVPAHLLQSAVGVIVKAGTEELVQPIVVEQLQRRGLEKMVIPAIARSISSSVSINPLSAMLPAALNPLSKMYQGLMDFAKSNGHAITLAVELYSLASPLYTVHLPVDHQAEFVVPEKISTEELKDKLACAKFDSDASSSESEPSGDEEYNEEGEQSETAAAGDKDE